MGLISISFSLKTPQLLYTNLILCQLKVDRCCSLQGPGKGRCDLHLVLPRRKLLFLHSVFACRARGNRPRACHGSLPHSVIQFQLLTAEYVQVTSPLTGPQTRSTAPKTRSNTAGLQAITKLGGLLLSRAVFNHSAGRPLITNFFQLTL